jgi:hypothetical protein
LLPVSLVAAIYFDSDSRPRFLKGRPMASPSDPGQLTVDQLGGHVRRLIDSTRTRIAEAQRAIRAAHAITRRDSSADAADNPPSG